MKLTPMQRAVLSAIHDVEFSVAPRLATQRDVARMLKFAGPSSVAYHLKALRRAGLVLSQQGRFGLCLTQAGKKEARREA